MKINVLKFGGSSVASFDGINCIQKIINKSGCKKIVVVSAFGKRSEDDEKLTNLLIECVGEKLKNNNFEKIYQKIENKIGNICKELNVEYDFKKQLKKIKKQFKKTNDIDWFISRGEFITSKIIAKHLNLPFIDAKNVMFFDGENPNYEKINSALKKITKKHDTIIIPGFYGIKNGNIFVSSRGGSDLTGAIIARAINCKLYKNFTDKDGIYPINPNIYKCNKPIKKISYQNVALMTNCDANVLHKDCAGILQGTKTTIKVLSTFEFWKGGTKVVQRQTKNNFVCIKKDQNKIVVIVNAKSQKTIQKLAQLVDVKKSKQTGNKLQIVCHEDEYEKLACDCFKFINRS